LAYLESVKEAAYLAARATGGFKDFFYRIGGHITNLRFAGSALVPRMTPALAHLRVKGPQKPELKVYLWDSASTGTKMPTPMWKVNGFIFRGEVPGYNNERIYATYHQWAEVFCILDIKEDFGIFWVSDATHLDYTFGSSPLRDIFHWWMLKHGKQLVHGGGVGTPEGGVLLTGMGGSGKSTTALACLNSELLYAGDDHVLVKMESLPYLYSLYNTAKLEGNHIHTFPNLLHAVDNKEKLETQKARIFLHQCYADKIIAGFPLRGIMLPRVTGQLETGLRKISPAEALIALAPTTIYQLPKAGQIALKNMSNIVKKVPTYILALGTNISQIPKIISKFLSEL
jgi:hypothetical protein